MDRRLSVDGKRKKKKWKKSDDVYQWEPETRLVHKLVRDYSTS